MRRLNAVRTRLAALDWHCAAVSEIAHLKREELMAASSVMLHEVYFESLGGHGDKPPTGLTDPPATLAQALARDFGSVAAWQAEFTAMAKPLAAGMDKHAYGIDFSADAAAYVDRLIVNLNWQRIGARYRLAAGESEEEEALFLP